MPIYLHPANPMMIPAAFEGYPGLSQAIFGWAAETGGHALRLVLSGLFDRFPSLTIILGHMGEGLPFYLWRITHGLSRSMGEKTFREIFCRHFWITTSGFFSDPALVCCMMEMGIDRILFSVDYPYASNAAGKKFLESLPFAPADIEKIAHGNADRLLRLKA